MGSSHSLVFRKNFFKEAIILAKGRKATDIVEEIVKPVCDQMGLILWDVRFEKETAKPRSNPKRRARKGAGRSTKKGE